MNMWINNNSNFILSELNQIKGLGKTVTLWQNRKQGRIQYQGILVSVDSDLCEIQLESEYCNVDLKLHAAEVLFVHDPISNILFKKGSFNNDGLKVTFKTPNEIMLKERRRTPRLHYKYQDYKLIEFKLSGRNVSSAPKYSGILLNLTVEGAGLVIPNSELNSLSKGDVVDISRITDQELPEGLEAKVVFTTPFKDKDDITYESSHVGIQYNSTLDSIKHKTICNVIVRKQQMMKGLEVNTFNGLNPIEQDRILNKIAEEDKALANKLRERIEELDRLRYLTLSMKQEFLKEVNMNFLPTALRLSSKELIYDFFHEVTENVREEFLYKYEELKSPSAILKAQEVICHFVNDKVRNGAFVLDATSFEVMV